MLYSLSGNLFGGNDYDSFDYSVQGEWNSRVLLFTMFARLLSKKMLFFAHESYQSRRGCLADESHIEINNSSLYSPCKVAQSINEAFAITGVEKETKCFQCLGMSVKTLVCHGLQPPFLFVQDKNMQLLTDEEGQGWRKSGFAFPSDTVINDCMLRFDQPICVVFTFTQSAQ
jgi:hypothetical protein